MKSQKHFVICAKRSQIVEQIIQYIHIDRVNYCVSDPLEIEIYRILNKLYVVQMLLNNNQTIVKTQMAPLKEGLQLINELVQRKMLEEQELEEF